MNEDDKRDIPARYFDKNLVEIPAENLNIYKQLQTPNEISYFSWVNEIYMFEPSKLEISDKLKTLSENKWAKLIQGSNLNYLHMNSI